ncbi:MAG TPA: hypothetical protein PKH07_05965, partial [bacterium]|nr:hypothetical protein [bacterium]
MLFRKKTKDKEKEKSQGDFSTVGLDIFSEESPSSEPPRQPETPKQTGGSVSSPPLKTKAGAPGREPVADIPALDDALVLPEDTELAQSLP